MRNVSLDAMKVTLAFFVIFLHTGVLKEYEERLSFILVNGVFRVAVPLFLMISGFYFFKTKEKLKLYEWNFRIIVLYVVWTLIYMPFWISNGNITNLLINIFNGYFVLWYLVGLIFAGNVFYLMREWSSRSLLAVALVLYILGWCIQTLGNMYIFDGTIGKILNSHPSSRNGLFFCLPFFIFGFLIKRHNVIEAFKPSVFFIILATISVVVESYVNYKFVSGNESLDLLISLVFACPLIFISVSKIKFYSNDKNLSMFASAIFLCHPLMISLARRFDSNNSLIIASLSSILAILLVLLNKRLKYII